MKRIACFAFSLVVVSLMPTCFSGCDRPEKDPGFYGELVDEIPDMPESREPFEVPDPENLGIDEAEQSRTSSP